MKRIGFGFLSVVAVVALPNNLSFEPVFVAEAQAEDVAAPLPAYVSLTMRGEILMASAETVAVARDSRRAAEVLSQRFAAASSDDVAIAAAATPSSVAAVPRVSEPISDPKVLIKAAAVSDPSADLPNDPKPATRKTAGAKLKHAAEAKHVVVVKKKKLTAKQKAVRATAGHVKRRAPGYAETSTANERVSFFDRLVNPALWWR